MDPHLVESVITKRYDLPRAPTLVAHVGARKSAIVFNRLRSSKTRHLRSKDVPREQSFTLQVPLTIFPWQAWFSGRQKIVPPTIVGNVYLFDLTDNPTVGLDTSFDIVQFNISQSALDALAEESGLRKAGGLHAPCIGCPDMVMLGLARTLVAVMEQPEEETKLFTEYVALAFHAHVLRTYGNVPVQTLAKRSQLALWQFRRACEFIEENLDGDPSIADIANECGLSSSHFAKAFKQTTGLPPHAWLSLKRVERAKRMMQDARYGLAEVAIACGFVDQSHFARVFSKIVGSSPGRWRRLQRC